MMKPRKNETIGGGYFVFRRGKKTGRIGCKTPWVPFEHDSFAAAMAESVRLAKKYPGETFEVFETSGYSCCGETNPERYVFNTRLKQASQ